MQYLHFKNRHKRKIYNNFEQKRLYIASEMRYTARACGCGQAFPTREEIFITSHNTNLKLNTL